MKTEDSIFKYFRKKDFVRPMFFWIGAMAYFILTFFTEPLVPIVAKIILMFLVTAIVLIIVFVRAAERKLWLTKLAEGIDLDEDVTLARKNLNLIGW